MFLVVSRLQWSLQLGTVLRLLPIDLHRDWRECRYRRQRMDLMWAVQKVGTHWVRSWERIFWLKIALRGGVSCWWRLWFLVFLLLVPLQEKLGQSLKKWKSLNSTCKENWLKLMQSCSWKWRRWWSWDRWRNGRLWIIVETVYLRVQLWVSVNVWKKNRKT